MANRTRRIGVLGTVSLAIIVGFGVLLFIRVTSQAQPPRRCVGGAAVPGAVTDADPVAAIRQFAPQASPPPYVREAVTEIPDGGWIRRSDSLYEHGADGNRLLQLDVTVAADGYTVTGLWLCSPIAA